MSDTESAIKNAVIEILLKDGNFGFTLFDVAKKSKVSRTVIHYYFRSRDNLLSVVTNEILVKMVAPRYDLLFASDSLKRKIMLFIEESERVCRSYPYVDIFIMIRYPDSTSLQSFFDRTLTGFHELTAEVQAAIDQKNLRYQEVEHFFADLFSLSSFSYIFLNFYENIRSHTGTIVDKEDKNKDCRITNILFSK
ncbi:TetR/AcrR family transcriptional regulator [Chryseobacterium sp. JJR-5R]|uniref:TetR/AcrR family transcriptional regulator n=1 Tax=Chryseobacterium sp. JJR-5R TaxID=3093923 RepID=UPI002A76383B|nr:TetR/AcrR family transcriptional regulator [Chryseobacterium sp. JJR-5R]WPO84174.1 TetR/AcrR family transcriptional regulator [Chryseobacterium sp. JJR-5R]